MGAYAKALSVFKCPICRLKATHEVYNTYNALMGNFCKRHAEMEVAKLNTKLVVKASNGS